MRDNQDFERLMDRLMACFNRPKSKDVKQAYWTALAGVTDDEFAAAVATATTHCDRWPVPKVLLGFALEERARLRKLTHPTVTDDGLPCCPTCGAQPAWHDLVRPSGEVIQRMLTRHAAHQPCADYNQAHRWATEEV